MKNDILDTMGINIRAAGTGLAAILGVGAIILAILENPAWNIFLILAVLLWIISLVSRKL